MDFSSKYHDSRFPEQYASKHRESLSRRLNDKREHALLKRCLEITSPAETLADVGCGPGRFWPTLADGDAGELYALDISQAMLVFARERYPDGTGSLFRLAAGSVTALPFPDRAFDCVVSLRLLHHFGEPEARRRALAELARVSRGHVVVSLWTDGNYKAWRRRKLESRRGRRSYANRHVVPRGVLAGDFAAAGLEPVAHFDLIPRYSQWRYYVLRRT